MRGPGILWMLQTAAGMSMAGPLFYLAGSYLLTGQYVGGVAFLGFGLLVLYFPTFLVNRFGARLRRIGGPRTWIRRRIGREESPDSTRDTSDDDNDEDATDDRSSLRGRFGR
ncbi:hypothetical protein RBH26_11750 [Natronolimnohabitans sp. A-GB9]|uniref:hypothetical protein n=1 Tax=Natronolimnohabitans sp. A-GB9 TaxID=3069757 RepID=UPI0027AFC81D|nr:hypothetical protein [Natronolimnohabitans sp. A-GB9]MDQ2051155.1 hypothetical protein [Natronolimnohabitans sp. A-GB9]